jgi:hypothetical protein
MIGMTKIFRNFFRVAYGVNCGSPKKKKISPDLPLQKKPIGVARWLIRPIHTGFQSCVCGDTGGSQTRPARLGAFSVRLAQSVGVLWRCSVFCGDTPSLSPSYPPCIQFCGDAVGSNRASKAPHAPHQHKPTQSVAIGRSICTKPSPHPPKHPPNPPRHPISTHIEPV